jgi:preprotein translocase subunit SecB
MDPQVPLLLESYFVESLTYRAREGFDQKQPPLEQVDMKAESFEHKENRNRIMVRIEVKIGAKDTSNARCELDIKVVGFFALKEGLDEQLRAAMQSQNAPSILYGVARQVIVETTGNGPWGKLFLPTANFAVPAGSEGNSQQPHDEPYPIPAAARPTRMKSSWDPQRPVPLVRDRTGSGQKGTVKRSRPPV